MQIFAPDGQLLLNLFGPVSDRGELQLPVRVAVVYDGLDSFAVKVAPGHKLDYLVLVTNQLGPNNLNVYGFLVQHPTDEAASEQPGSKADEVEQVDGASAEADGPAAGEG